MSKEIKSRRVALSKLSSEHLERTGRPFRIAIDISIWQFQTQAGQGGKNPALRTLYYRLLRLLSLCIQPIFVFDGPNKPPLKRGARTGHNEASLPNFMAKQLIKAFGFPFHNAPGEAEAECAYFQQAGIVDAVLSDDIDTLMFGSKMTLKNWSSEGTRGNKSPTHVDCLDAVKTLEQSGLDRAGMILVAMMSGGDYLPEGIPGCGPKLACEAARAGFGRDLLEVKKGDAISLRTWKERLEYELTSNESGFFTSRHRKLAIPESFPDLRVLKYYTHPCVSSLDAIEKLREEIRWYSAIDIQELRVFVRDAFDWNYRAGARKFVRGLAPALLAQKLCVRAVDSKDCSRDGSSPDEDLVKVVHDNRIHLSTDGSKELRISYIPAEVVLLNLDEEEEAPNYSNDSDGELEESDVEQSQARERSMSPRKQRGPSTYDPTKIEKIWILKPLLSLGVPRLVQDYEESLKDPIKFATRKSRAREATLKGSKKTGMPVNSLHQYLRPSKPGMDGANIHSDGVVQPAPKRRTPLTKEKAKTIGSMPEARNSSIFAPFRVQSQPESTAKATNGSSKALCESESSNCQAEPRSSQTQARLTNARITKNTTRQQEASSKNQHLNEASTPPTKKRPKNATKLNSNPSKPFEQEFNPFRSRRRISDADEPQLPSGTTFPRLGITGPPLPESNALPKENVYIDLLSSSPVPPPSRKHMRRSSSSSEVSKRRPCDADGDDAENNDRHCDPDVAIDPIDLKPSTPRKSPSPDFPSSPPLPSLSEIQANFPLNLVSRSSRRASEPPSPSLLPSSASKPNTALSNIRRRVVLRESLEGGFRILGSEAEAEDGRGSDLANDNDEIFDLEEREEGRGFETKTQRKKITKKWEDHRESQRWSNVSFIDMTVE